MNWMDDMPLKRKLTFVVLGTCIPVLLLACVVLAIYESIAFRRAMARDMSVLADILGENSQAALTFEDKDAARKILKALQSEPHVLGACLYSRDGSLFAQYSRPDWHGSFPAAPEKDGHQFKSGSLLLFRQVSLNGKDIGTICLNTDLQAMFTRLRLFGGLTVLVLVASLGIALALSARLQRPITEPILALAETAKTIAERKDYTVRAARQGRNEVGMLSDAFNQMLEGLADREAKVHGQLAKLELLNRITRAIGERQNLRSIFQVVLHRLEDDLPVDFGCICLHDQTDGVLRVGCVSSKSQPLAGSMSLVEETTFPIDENGLSRCIKGQLVYEPDVTDVQFPFPQRFAHAGLRSLVFAPLLVESNVFGVLIASRKQAHAFSSGDCEFLRQLSEHVALAAHQAEIYTALQRAYDDLRQTQQTVMQQERLRALGQMASGIAHDINNALSPVALYTESLLEQDPTLSARARDYLQTIQRAVDDVAHTVSRMREFYRQREPQLSLVSVSPNDLIPQVVDLTRARWSDMPQQRGVMIEVRSSLAPALPPIMGIESEIREALTNLVFNAVDAMPNGGLMTITTRLVETTFPASQGAIARHVHIEVTDTGLGMDDDTRRRCLEPFFTTKGERGTGLGLAMVYGVMQRHRGEIEIDSRVGAGTTIRLIFPELAAPSAAGPQTPSASTPIPRLRILIVDDDPLLIKSLRDTMEADGHLVSTANGGQAGIDSFRAAQERNEPFAVVITDLGMPYVDGRKVASAIKAASPSTPVILLTGWGQRLVSEGDIPPHVDHVLSKPPKLRQLRETLALCHSNGAPK
jgi:signal transduction histidine kinase/ActR/RegA family two-component response regulator